MVAHLKSHILSPFLSNLHSGLSCTPGHISLALRSMPRPAFVSHMRAEITKGSSLETPHVLLCIVAVELHLPNVKFMEWNIFTEPIVIIEMRACLNSDLLTMDRSNHFLVHLLHLGRACGFVIFAMGSYAATTVLSPFGELELLAVESHFPIFRVGDIVQGVQEATQTHGALAWPTIVARFHGAKVPWKWPDTGDFSSHVPLCNWGPACSCRVNSEGHLDIYSLTDFGPGTVTEKWTLKGHFQVGVMVVDKAVDEPIKELPVQGVRGRCGCCTNIHLNFQDFCLKGMLALPY
jgi:hypothetical protein